MIRHVPCPFHSSFSLLRASPHLQVAVLQHFSIHTHSQRAMEWPGRHYPPATHTGASVLVCLCGCACVRGFLSINHATWGAGKCRVSLCAIPSGRASIQCPSQLASRSLLPVLVECRSAPAKLPASQSRMMKPAGSKLQKQHSAFPQPRNPTWARKQHNPRD